jgi:hypothetical protein
VELSSSIGTSAHCSVKVFAEILGLAAHNDERHAGEVSLTRWASLLPGLRVGFAAPVVSTTVHRRARSRAVWEPIETHSRRCRSLCTSSLIHHAAGSADQTCGMKQLDVRFEQRRGEIDPATAAASPDRLTEIRRYRGRAGSSFPFLPRRSALIPNRTLMHGAPWL